MRYYDICDIILSRSILRGALNNMRKVEEVKKNHDVLDNLSEKENSKLSQKILDLCLWY